MTLSRQSISIALGTTQSLAWASSYYIPAVLADVVARDLGISSTAFFAAFSVSLLVAAAIGPKVGRTIDAVGGRRVLMLSNLSLAAGLTMLACTHSLLMLWLAWLMLGIGMGLGLYDAAFATLGQLFGAEARGSITSITLMAGFASTIGWPVSAWGVGAIGWRDTCLAWAGAHILLGVPINSLLPLGQSTRPTTSIAQQPHIAWDRPMLLLAFAMAAAWIVTAAMAAHLPRLLEAAGATTSEAIAAGMLIGPAQVAARVLEASAFRRFHPLVSARLAALMHPVAAALVVALGPGAANVFALLHGAGNGILTIARGTVPLAIFGPKNYGYRLGLLGAPARIAQASAPLLFGLLIDNVGTWALAVSAGLSIAALAALAVTPTEHRQSSEQLEHSLKDENRRS
jgi:predicted MFS family arabinose efflux permease